MKDSQGLKFPRPKVAVASVTRLCSKTTARSGSISLMLARAPAVAPCTPQLPITPTTLVACSSETLKASPTLPCGGGPKPCCHRRSSATRHLAPHPRQIEGDTKLGVPPLHWNEGGDVDNIRSLIETTFESLAHHFPEIRSGTYDFDTGTFRTGEGEPISDESFDAWATTSGGRAARAGSRTLKRGVLLNTLLHRAGEEGSRLLHKFYAGMVNW